MAVGQPKRLDELARALSGAVEASDVRDRLVFGISTESRTLRPGELFVALSGMQVDGHAYIGEAVRRGAAAVVTEKVPHDPGVPWIRVADSRSAVAELAAAWYGGPAGQLRLVGITGTLGKTSTLSMLEAILSAGGIEVGTIGSLGIRIGIHSERTRLTTPEPLALHRTLARFVSEGARVAAMEVTSHALDQQRVRGLAFDLGVFTNIALLEHMEYHGSFRDYVAAKSRFLDRLAADAPLIYPAGDRVIRSLLRERGCHGVSCGAGGRVSVRVERLLLDRGGTRVVVSGRSPLPRIGGGTVQPFTISIELRVLGRPNVMNAVLAAAAGLCLGVQPDAVRDALATFPAPWRRMQIVHRGRFTVLDDTVGHPDSIGGVFEVAARIRHRRLHVVYAVRGGRGDEINRRDAETLAIWARCANLHTLVVTASEDTTDDANRVDDAERDAFLEALHRRGVDFRFFDDLASAVNRVADRLDDGDLLLLLGAQGMDRGAEFLRDRLRIDRAA